jgi:hypothetical protein
MRHAVIAKLFHIPEAHIISSFQCQSPSDNADLQHEI